MPTSAVWYKFKFLESADNLKPLIKLRISKAPSTKIAREIAACLQQGRLFYEAAAQSPLEIRPLQQFYGMVSFAKALVIARTLKPLHTMCQAHGVADISGSDSRIENLTVRIRERGTFQEFNTILRHLNRVRYIAAGNRRGELSHGEVKRFGRDGNITQGNFQSYSTIESVIPIDLQ